MISKTSKKIILRKFMLKLSVQREQKVKIKRKTKALFLHHLFIAILKNDCKGLVNLKCLICFNNLRTGFSYAFNTTLSR